MDIYIGVTQNVDNSSTYLTWSQYAKIQFSEVSGTRLCIRVYGSGALDHMFDIGAIDAGPLPLTNDA